MPSCHIHNPVLYLLNCVDLEWLEPFSHHTRCQLVQNSELLSKNKYDFRELDFLAATNVFKCPPKQNYPVATGYVLIEVRVFSPEVVSGFIDLLCAHYPLCVCWIAVVEGEDG